jgi:tRNA(His) guanylyltransferase
MLGFLRFTFAQGTDSGAKNELLFATFGINYNNIEAIFRKGTLIYCKPKIKSSSENNNNNEMEKNEDQSTYLVTNDDVFAKEFWTQNGHLLKG